MWECLNTTYNALAERERAAKRLGPHEFLSYVGGRAAMFAGLADSTLSRMTVTGSWCWAARPISMSSWRSPGWRSARLRPMVNRDA